MADEKDVKAYFCPKCKSVDVRYVFGLSSWLGMSPRMRCKKCKFEMPSFPMIVTNKKELAKNGVTNKLRRNKK